MDVKPGCYFCRQVFESKNMLQKHWKSHNCPELCHCSNCNNFYSWIEGLYGNEYVVYFNLANVNMPHNFFKSDVVLPPKKRKC